MPVIPATHEACSPRPVLDKNMRLYLKKTKAKKWGCGSSGRTTTAYHPKKKIHTKLK
jgi:hypothetical protein